MIYKFIIYFIKYQMDIIPSILKYDPYDAACMPSLSYDSIIIISIVASILGIFWTGYNLLMLRRIDLTEIHQQQNQQGLIQEMPQQQRTLLLQFGYKVYDASFEFIKYEYLLCLIFALIAFFLLWFLTDLGPTAAIAFIVGTFINLITGLISFVISTRSSCRVAYCSKYGLPPAFKTNYQASTIIAFSITSFNLLSLTVGIQLLKQEFDLSNSSTDPKYYVQLFEAVAAYGLGVSFVAMFTRLGGNIFQAATESGSELLGKVQGSLPFNHPKNAATVGKHAGYNSGGMVGMNNDSIGSYCELTCVTFLLSSNSLLGFQGQGTVCAVSLSSLCLPLVILSLGMIVSVITSVIGVIVVWAQSQNDLSKILRTQRIIPTLLMSGLLYLCVFISLPSQFQLLGVNGTYNAIHAPWQVYVCGVIGLIVSFILFLFSYIFNNKDLPFVNLLVQKCSAGSAATITFGLAFGYFNSFVPIILYSIAAFFSYNLLGYYGVSIAALGLLSSTPIYIALQSMYSLSSNALTSAQIANLNEQQRDTLKQLTSEGSNNLTINRSINFGGVALVSMTLFGGFLSNSHLDTPQAQNMISLTDPLIFAGLLLGGIFPFVLSGLTVRAARKAVSPFKDQIQRQIKEDQGIFRGQSEADYAGSIKPLAARIIISLIGPIILVLVAPFIFGLIIGPKIVSGILLGMIVSGLQFSTSVTSSSDAWSSAKKMLQSGVCTDQEGKVLDIHSESYKSANLGFQVGRFLGKCGSSIGSSIKVMGMLAVLFGSQFASVHS